MQVYLIRHAQSENNVLSEDTLHRRKADPDLTELGYQQREQVAAYLAAPPAHSFDSALTHLYTSAMYRSLLTAQSIASALQLKPAVWVDLHEKGGLFLRQNGHASGFGGMTRRAISNQFPGYQLPAEVSDAGWYDVNLGMEPEPHSLFRAIKVAKALRERSKTSDVIGLVSHAGFLDVLLKAIFEQLPSRPYTMRYYHYNTAITRIDYQGARPILHYLNRVEHLPPALRSA